MARCVLSRPLLNSGTNKHVQLHVGNRLSLGESSVPTTCRPTRTLRSVRSKANPRQDRPGTSPSEWPAHSRHSPFHVVAIEMKSKGAAW